MTIEFKPQYEAENPIKDLWAVYEDGKQTGSYTAEQILGNSRYRREFGCFKLARRAMDDSPFTSNQVYALAWAILELAVALKPGGA